MPHSESAEPAVVIDALTVVRSKREVLQNLSASMGRGRVTGLLGPSGSGKTTLIRCLVGAQQTAAGSVTVLGLPAGSPALRRRLGYVTQAPAVYEDLTVAENLHYFASVMGAPRSTVSSLLAEFELKSIAHQLVRNTSGGQRARTSLVCALVGDPELLLLDEPTVGQDPVLREQMWDAFRARAAAGTTVLVSSHVMDEASRCDDLLLLRAGALLAQGTPAAIQAEAGAGDMDAAFLALIRRAAAGGDADTAGRPAGARHAARHEAAESHGEGPLAEPEAMEPHGERPVAGPDGAEREAAQHAAAKHEQAQRNPAKHEGAQQS